MKGTGVCEPDLHQSHSADTVLWWRKAQCLLQVPSKENRQPMLERPWLPKDLQRGVFKGHIRGDDCRGPDQLVDILLISLWWGSSMTFYFFLNFNWSGVYHHHALNFLYLVGALVSAEQLRDMCQDISSPWGRAKGPWLGFMAKLLFCFSCLHFFVSAFSHFSD